MIRHLRSERGLSRASNIGLRVARGDIIAIPDDDCWYPKDLLATVAAWFESHPEFGLLSTALRTADNDLFRTENASDGSPLQQERLLHLPGGVGGPVHATVGFDRGRWFQ